MRSEITADYLTLMNQGTTTATHYLGRILHDLREMGIKDPLKNNPDLVNTLLIVAGQDYTCAIQMKILQGELQILSEGISDIAMAITKEDTHEYKD